MSDKTTSGTPAKLTPEQLATIESQAAASEAGSDILALCSHIRAQEQRINRESADNMRLRDSLNKANIAFHDEQNVRAAAEAEVRRLKEAQYRLVKSADELLKLAAAIERPEASEPLPSSAGLASYVSTAVKVLRNIKGEPAPEPPKGDVFDNPTRTTNTAEAMGWYVGGDATETRVQPGTGETCAPVTEAASEHSARSSPILTRDQHEKLWTAVSKLESQVCRNPDLPPVYKQIVSDAFEVLRGLQWTAFPTAPPSKSPPHLPSETDPAPEPSQGGAQPRCPKCGDSRLQVNWKDHLVYCPLSKCDYKFYFGMRSANTSLTDFTQFFSHSSAEGDGWVSIRRKLPTDGENLLVAYNEMAHDQDWFASPIDIANPLFIKAHRKFITHWRKLPAPPRPK